MMKRNVKSAMAAGELVAVRPDGTSRFPDLQAAMKAGARLTLVADPLS